MPRKRKPTPEEIALKVDAFKHFQTKRLALKHEYDDVYAEELLLRGELIKMLQQSGVKSLGGAVATATLKDKQIVIVTDWEDLYAHIKKTGSFELLQRRVGEGAVKERWDNGEAVPGVIEDIIPDISITKAQ